MNIDVAVAGQLFVDGVQRRFNAVRPCIPDDLAFPLKGFIVDRLTIDSPSLHRIAAQSPIRLADGSKQQVNSYRMQVWTPVNVHLTTLENVKAGGLAGPANTIPLTFTVYFDVFGELQTDENDNVIGAGIRTQYAGKDTMLPASDLDAAVDAALAAAGQFVPLDLGPLGQAFGKPVEIRNIGVATDLKGDRVVIRIEVDTVAADPVAAWQKFYGSPPDMLADRDWAIFIDRRILGTAAETQIKEGIEKEKDLDINHGPTTSWQPSVPGFTVDVGLKLVDACPAFDIDIDADVTAKTSIKLVGPQGQRQLQLEVEITWNASDWDVIKCGLAGGFLAAKYGASVGLLGGPLGAVIGAFAAVVLVTIAVAIIADMAAPPSGAFAKADCKTIEEDDDHVVIRCARPLVMPAIPLLGTLDPDDIAADSQGLYLRGTVLAVATGPELFVEVWKLKWAQEVTCSALQVQWVKAGWVEVTGSLGLSVCRINVLDDALGIFSPYWTVAHKIGVLLKKPLQEQYFANPYPCLLAIRTSRGARCANLGALPPPPPEPNQTQKIILLDKHCWKFYKEIPLKGFEPGWVDVFDPGDRLVIRHWDVAVFGLPAGSVVDLCKLLGVNCDELTSAPVDARGHVRLQATTTPGDRLFIRSHGDPIADGPLDPRHHGFAITQRLFVLERVIELPGLCRDVTAFEGAASAQLAAVTDAGLHVWKHAALHQLVPTIWRLGYDAREVVPVRGGFATIGDAGVTVFRAEEDGRVRVVASRSSRDAFGDIADPAEPSGERWRNRRVSSRAPWLDRSLWMAPFVVRVASDGARLELYRAGPPVRPVSPLSDEDIALTDTR